MGRKTNIKIDDRYGKLKILERVDNNKWGDTMWVCVCECGNVTKPIHGYNLRNGNTQSCGCYRKEKVSKIHKGENNFFYKHGLRHTKEYIKICNQKHRALKANAEGTHTINDLKYIYKHQKSKCPCCSEFISFEKITIDHIIALSKGGSNYPSNIQLLCKSCNSAKGNRHSTDYREHIPLFLN